MKIERSVREYAKYIAKEHVRATPWGGSTQFIVVRSRVLSLETRRQRKKSKEVKRTGIPYVQ